VWEVKLSDDFNKDAYLKKMEAIVKSNCQLYGINGKNKEKWIKEYVRK
jgi:hypothetical protein